MVPILLPYAGLAALSLLQVRALRRARAEHQLGRRARQDLVRTVRIAATELRNTALGLAGHAGTLPAPARQFLSGAEATLLDVAESLLCASDVQRTERRLEEEEVKIGHVVDFAVNQISALLGPGTRVWRVSPGLEGAVLFADRRAFHQMLMRVLGSAALASAEGGWIAISAEFKEESWSLVIEDEGTGLPAGASSSGEAENSRGVGMGLALAGSLMKAHGGELSLTSTQGVGTRACLVFPRARVLTPS